MWTLLGLAHILDAGRRPGDVNVHWKIEEFLGFYIRCCLLTANTERGNFTHRIYPDPRQLAGEIKRTVLRHQFFDHGAVLAMRWWVHCSGLIQNVSICLHSVYKLQMLRVCRRVSQDYAPRPKLPTAKTDAQATLDSRPIVKKVESLTHPEIKETD